jgi:hypothetical protein
VAATDDDIVESPQELGLSLSEARLYPGLPRGEPENANEPSRPTSVDASVDHARALIRGAGGQIHLSSWSDTPDALRAEEWDRRLCSDEHVRRLTLGRTGHLSPIETKVDAGR